MIPKMPRRGEPARVNDPEGNSDGIPSRSSESTRRWIIGFGFTVSPSSSSFSSVFFFSFFSLSPIFQVNRPRVMSPQLPSFVATSLWKFYDFLPSRFSMGNFDSGERPIHELIHSVLHVKSNLRFHPLGEFLKFLCSYSFHSKESLLIAPKPNFTESNGIDSDLELNENITSVLNQTYLLSWTILKGQRSHRQRKHPTSSENRRSGRDEVLFYQPPPPPPQRRRLLWMVP